MTSLNYKYAIRFNYERSSILEAARRFFPVLQAMARSSQDFVAPLLINQKKEVPIRPLELDLETGTMAVAKAIIELRGREYKRESGLAEITLDYSQDLGFSFLVQYKPNGEHFCFSAKIGSAKGGSMATFNQRGAPKGYAYTKRFIEAIVGTGLVRYAVVGLIADGFVDFTLQFNGKLGWITYFPKDYPLPIPDDLPGIEYEHTPEGKYLILTREDFTTDPVKFEAGKQKLMATMEEIARRVPGYREA
jgi:hypothetical protein